MSINIRVAVGRKFGEFINFINCNTWDRKKKFGEHTSGKAADLAVRKVSITLQYFFKNASLVHYLIQCLGSIML